MDAEPDLIFFPRRVGEFWDRGFFSRGGEGGWRHDRSRSHDDMVRPKLFGLGPLIHGRAHQPRHFFFFSHETAFIFFRNTITKQYSVPIISMINMCIVSGTVVPDYIAVLYI